MNAITLAISVLGLLVSLTALKLAYEQARSYLFSSPSMYIDSSLGGLVIRNFGPGAMLDVRGRVTFRLIDGQNEIIDTYQPGIGSGEYASLAPNETLDELPIRGVDATFTFKTVRRSTRTRALRLEGTGASQLG